jgi:aminoglycoside phosphotransferase (APT) family kinase protein
MPAEPAADDRLEVEAPLVRRLIGAQFPHWAGLDVRPVAHAGWDNRTFHLGDAMTVRMPSAARYVAQVEKEHRWLPRLARRLPLPIPELLARGEPGEGYPWPWSVYRWLDGTPAARARIDDTPRFARDLAAFLAALYAIDASDGPPAGTHNFHRGGDLAVYDAQTRAAVDALGDDIDRAAVLTVWEEALASRWQEPPVWVHGDVAAGNLLVRDGCLGAVIDFGSAGVGDPACDLVIAWTFLEGEAREAFCAALPLDQGTWGRARGWALWKALIRMAARQTAPADVAADATIVDTILAGRS